MTTANIAVTSAWTKIADITDSELLATWNDVLFLEVATTVANVAPAASLLGHLVPQGAAGVSRDSLGSGYVWARLPSTARISSLNVVATTYGSKTAFRSQQSFTRPNDTNAYLAGDVLGASTGATAAIEFTNMGNAGGFVMLTGWSFRVDVASVPSGMGSFLLHLYTAAPPSVLGDNAVWTLPAGDRANYAGFIELGTPASKTSTLYVQSDATNSTINKQVKLATDSTSLFGYLMTVNGYTPTAQVVKTVTLRGVAL